MAARFQRSNARPGRATTIVLSWVLFAAGIGLYLYTAAARHREDPEDRVTPTIGQMVRGMFGAALTGAEADDALTQRASLIQRFSTSMLWKDTVATGRRFFLSMALLFPA